MKQTSGPMTPEAFRRACPYCGAEPEQRCRMRSTGAAVSYAHLARIQAGDAAPVGQPGAPSAPELPGPGSSSPRRSG